MIYTAESRSLALLEMMAPTRQAARYRRKAGAGLVAVYQNAMN